ncbi:hypothetical protein BU23DRAFT_564065 [Bimuria novae-zelandiae CBS 107.79]|uniref:Uncharacterized protein n=1 Tax=Bimuria novae-zelandiae CBS 107.79 TaxID=1447943 RepID=A0A6A5VL80_9PLEO|nr:hypothetical protein BU23DRAFT_564065 [Bimuria novae-zelandiae CBS 107.79]
MWPDAAETGEIQYSNSYLGPLCNVQGVENVRLARRVKDVEQAAFIIPDASSAPAAWLISLQWDHGFDMDTELYGRVTMNKYTGIGTWESWHSESSSEQRKEIGTESGTGAEDKREIKRGDEHVRERWEFFRWNAPSYGATREREEESIRQPSARQHWEQAVKRYMLPVQTWEQERWDIETPHQSPNAPREDDMDEDDMDGDGMDEDESMSNTENIGSETE